MDLPMHAESSEREPLEPFSGVERAVISELLSGEHGPWTREELMRAIAGPHGSQTSVEDAITHLYDTGLVHVFGPFGEFVTPTRAARAMDEVSEGA
jgi:hypothetical protein